MTIGRGGRPRIITTAAQTMTAPVTMIVMVGQWCRMTSLADICALVVFPPLRGDREEIEGLPRRLDAEHLDDLGDLRPLTCDRVSELLGAAERGRLRGGVEPVLNRLVP